MLPPSIVICSSSNCFRSFPTATKRPYPYFLYFIFCLLSVLVFRIGMSSVTTVFALPTASSGIQTSGHLHVPVAAITGGAVGGIVLALFAVVGWKWWGRQIQKHHRKELQIQRARRAAAYRQAVIDNKGDLSNHSFNFASGSSPSLRSASIHTVHSVSSDPRRSRSSSLSRPHTPSDRRVKFTSPNQAGQSPTPSLPPVPPVPPLPSSISAPMPLRPIQNTSGLAASSGKNARRLSKTRRLSPPAPPSFQRATIASTAPQPQSASTTTASPRSSTALKAAGHAISQKQTMQNPISSDASSGTGGQEADADQRLPIIRRLPRLNLKGSLTSLSAEAHRQSRASQNTTSDRSSNRRWSWWSLLSGPGFSFGQIGIGTGKNRLSADTSLYTDWSEEDPSLPIGYAYTGPDSLPSSVTTHTIQRSSHKNVHLYQSVQSSDRH